MKLGSTDISKIYLGSTEVTKGMLGSTEVYSSGPDYSEPFYIEDISGSDNSVTIKDHDGNHELTIYKSTDKVNWSLAGRTSKSGLTIELPANSKVYLRCSTSAWGWAHNDCNTIYCSYRLNVGGNIMSLLYGDSFTGEERTFPSSNDYTLARLFNGPVVSAEKLLLPATTLAPYCYQYMFFNCTSLTTAPALPATTLARNCYTYMFYGCTSLTTAPALPATTLQNECYKYMFSGCTSLTTAPALPATTLQNECYDYMFYGCTSLTSAPALPATTLATYCYYGMFQNCTSLTTAPALPATTLANYCYGYMFSNCTSLNYVICLATNISATQCTFSWLLRVASTGTFVKNSAMTSWATGTSAIPSGWTVQNA